MLYRELFRPFLFCLDPERAHRTVFEFLKLTQHVPAVKKVLERQFSFAHPALETELFGRRFANPVGCAAGFDKSCEIFDALSCFGFGFVECGTVTAKDQSGNPGPRIFRLEEYQALINRLGFNNRGALWVEERLKRVPPSSIPFGINIGKSKVTEMDKAAEDYIFSFEKLYPFAHYFTINVSSPNTPGLRDLEKNLDPLLLAIQNKNAQIAGGKKLKPIFVKVSPDLSENELKDAVSSCLKRRVTGLIATNTTVSREGVGVHLPSPIEGGLSGEPLKNKSTAVLKQIYQAVRKDLVLIGVGGIFSAQDAYDKIKCGASLVQIYTGWVYGGPSTVGEINKGLVNLVERDGFKNILEAVGAGA